MEIGGYLGMEQSAGREFYSDLVAVNSTRNAFLYIMKARRLEKVYLPFFLCDSVAKLCRREHIKYEFYHIDNQMRPIFEKKLKERECIYIVNYYGLFDERDISMYKQQYPCIIWDNAQAFFQKPIKGIDTIYSCRKFFGVPDGAYLSTEKEYPGNLETDVSKDRMAHILGRYEEEASFHYAEFKENDRRFEELPLMYMSKLTHNLLKMINYDEAKKKREANYQYLHTKLGKYNCLYLSGGGDRSICIPILHQKRHGVKKNTIRKENLCGYVMA